MPDNPAPQPTDEELFTQALMRIQGEAQGSLCKFYEMVIKHEQTKESLVPAPHQKLMFDFIESHPWCVIRIPVSTGKTFSMAALALWLLGNEPGERWAIVSGSQAQAKKVLKMISDYITEPSLSDDLALVFPNLRQSASPGDAWASNQITVQREPGIRDPSVVAIGLEGKIVGSRISGLIADDLLDHQNTRTPEARAKTLSNFFGAIIPRLDPTGSRAIVTNTPWAFDDLTFTLEQEYGWATLTMDIYGYIRVSNVDASWIARALDEHIRPSTTRTGGAFDWYRLRDLDPDPDEKKPLWSERFTNERIAELRYGTDGKAATPPNEFARTYLCQPLDAGANRCQRDWIEKCKLRGMGSELMQEYKGTNATVTGIDLAIGKGKHHDNTVFFTLMDDDGDRVIIDIHSGKFDGPEIIDIMLLKAEKYNSLIMVEGNAAQKYLVDFAQQKNPNLRIQAHTTTRANKFDLDFGIESLFTELQNGIWVIPCARATAKVHPEIQKFADDCLYYQPPPAHTGDRLMAAWIAREGLRKRGGRSEAPSVGRRRDFSGHGFHGGGF
ncbi:MAG: hypothetical protein U9Q07_04155 [Planctomycetota bacterium]|nr:hypothetical protein [Planctomycetota bacterium]